MKILKMIFFKNTIYSFWLSLLILFGVIIKGQNSVGIVPSLTISPTTSVVNTSTYSVNGYYQNTGNTTLTGSLTINLAINTSTNTTPNYVFRTSVNYYINSFTPSSIDPFSITDNASDANQYFIDGNGTTVVVWPVFSYDNSTIHDSASTVVLVVADQVNVKEIQEFENNPLKISNPIVDNVQIEYDDLIYKNVVVTDINGREIQIVRDKKFNIALLSKGLYYLNFYNSQSNKVITKKVLIE